MPKGSLVSDEQRRFAIISEKLMRNRRFAESRAQSETFHPRLEDARSSCPDSELGWPYVEDERFALLAAYFEIIRKRLTETSAAEERAALLEEIESVIRDADEIIQRHLRITSRHCEFIARRFQEQGDVR